MRVRLDEHLHHRLCRSFERSIEVSTVAEQRCHKAIDVSDVDLHAEVGPQS